MPSHRRRWRPIQRIFISTTAGGGGLALRLDRQSGDSVWSSFKATLNANSTFRHEPLRSAHQDRSMRDLDAALLGERAKCAISISGDETTRVLFISTAQLVNQSAGTATALYHCNVGMDLQRTGFRITDDLEAVSNRVEVVGSPGNSGTWPSAKRLCSFRATLMNWSWYVSGSGRIFSVDTGSGRHRTAPPHTGLDTRDSARSWFTRYSFRGWIQRRRTGRCGASPANRACWHSGDCERRASTSAIG